MFNTYENLLCTDRRVEHVWDRFFELRNIYVCKTQLDMNVDHVVKKDAEIVYYET